MWMDKCSPCGSSMPRGENSKVICDSIPTDHSSVQNLSTRLAGKLQINDGNRMNTTNDVIQVPIEGHYIEHDEDDDDEEEDDFSEEELLAQMGYINSKPKRNSREPQRQHYAEEEEGTSDHFKNETPIQNLITTPTDDLKLVSALKGSREKQGKPNNECRISWAPDVYDPSPSAEYLALNGPERHKSKNVKGAAAAKNRQKSVGKGAGTSEGRGKRGKASGKDKKQAKKLGRGSKFPDYTNY